MTLHRHPFRKTLPTFHLFQLPFFYLHLLLQIFDLLFKFFGVFHMLLFFLTSLQNCSQSVFALFKCGAHIRVGIPTLVHQCNELFRGAAHVTLFYRWSYTSKNCSDDLFWKAFVGPRPGNLTGQQFIHQHTEGKDIDFGSVVVAHYFRCHPRGCSSQSCSVAVPFLWQSCFLRGRCSSSSSRRCLLVCWFVFFSFGRANIGTRQS